MKKTLLFFAIFFISFLQAQLKPVMINDNLSILNRDESWDETAVYHKGYIYYGLMHEGKIIRVNTKINSSPIEIILDNTPYVSDISVVGDKLYFSQFSDATFKPNTGKISVLNLENNQLTVVRNNLQYPQLFAINNDELYIIESQISNVIDENDFEYNRGDFYIHDLVKNTKTLIQSYDYVHDLIMKENEIYLSEHVVIGDEIEDSKIWKYDTEKFNRTLIQNRYIYSNNISIKDDKLFADFENYSYLSYLDLKITNSNPNIIVNEPFIYKGDDTYITNIIPSDDDENVYVLARYELYKEGEELDYKKILFKVDLSKLAISDVNKNNIHLFPNPVVNLLSVSNLSKRTRYTIYDLLGKTILKGSTKQDIDVSNLTKGIYILKLENKYTQKFIKK